MLRDVPAHILYLNIWDTIGVIAYTLAIALLETVILFLLAVIPGLIIPERWMSGKYVTLASVLATVLALVAIALQVSIINEYPKRFLLIGIILILIGSIIAVFRVPKLEGITSSTAQRLLLLTGIYIFFDLIGVAIVLIRNVQG